MQICELKFTQVMGGKVFTTSISINKKKTKNTHTKHPPYPNKNITQTGLY